MKYLFLLFTFLSHALLQGHTTGFVIVPVADLLGSPIKGKSSAEILAWYQALPFCESSADKPCYRLHQLVYGEQVDIVGQENDQLQITIPHIYYVTATTQTPQATYWTHKNNIISAQELQKYGVSQTMFPHTINWRNQTITPHNEITLKKPWTDPKSHVTFSAGTRFVMGKQPTTRHTVTGMFFDNQLKTVRPIKIPRSHALINTQLQNNEQKKAAFLALLKEWAQQDYIPYVWGGCSFTQNTACHFTKKDDGYLVCNWQQPIKTGFDCTGLVARALQMVQIPYFFKNSYTITQGMKPLSTNQTINEGDFIWIPGHVMVVSDLKDNLLIEARAYDHGYGRVHEIALGDVFKGIETYQQLLQHYQQQKPISRLDRAGQVRNVYREFKILPLHSLWQKTA